MKNCKNSETLEEGALNRAVMEANHKIARNEGDFAGTLRQNVIRVIGSYGQEQKPDEYDDRIRALKEAQAEARRKRKLAENYEQRMKDMDAFIESVICQIPEFDNDLVRRLIENIRTISAEKLLIQLKSGIVMEQEIRSG